MTASDKIKMLKTGTQQKLQAYQLNLITTKAYCDSFDSTINLISSYLVITYNILVSHRYLSPEATLFEAQSGIKSRETFKPWFDMLSGSIIVEYVGSEVNNGGGK